MSFTVPAYGSSPGASGGSVVITKPAGLAVNDIMIAHCVWDDANGTGGVTPPSGWTQIYYTTLATGHIGYVAYKTAVSADVAASNFTFTHAVNTGANQGAIAIVRGGRETTIGYAKNNATNASSSSVTISTITPNIASSLLLFLVCSYVISRDTTVQAIATSNPSWTELYDLGFNGSGMAAGCSLAYAVRPEVTATGNWTATLAAAEPYIAFAIAIEPGIQFSVTDTTTISDATPLMSLAFVATDTVTPSDTATASAVTQFTNETKPSSTWNNLSK